MNDLGYPILRFASNSTDGILRIATATEANDGISSPIRGMTPAISRGRVIQRAITVVTTRVAIAGTSIPYDNTIPQITEGDEVITLTVTPLSVGSRLYITAQLIVGFDTASGAGLAWALFKDSGVDAISAGFAFSSAGTSTFTIPIDYEEISGSVTPRTFRIRLGGSGSAVAMSLNGAQSLQRYGGATQSFIRALEVNL